MKIHMAGMVLAVGLLTVGPAMASTFFPQETVCVVGGEKFTYQAHMSYSTWGERPDGKPYGSSVFPIVPAECPGNGLIMYREFSKAELKKLPALLASADYATQRANETPFARIAWLETVLKPDSEDLSWIWLNASWEADDAPDQKARYQRAFLLAAKVQLPKAKGEARMLTLRMMNAHRELGEFDAALVLYDTLNPDALTKGLPDDPEAVAALDEEKQERWYAARFAGKLRAAVLRRDASAEPMDMIPTDLAAQYCFFKPEALDAFGRSYCETPEIKTAIEEHREYWTEAKAAMKAAEAEKTKQD